MNYECWSSSLLSGLVLPKGVHLADERALPRLMVYGWWSSPLLICKQVSNSAIKRHEWSGLWKLSLLTSLLQPLGLFLLCLLPKNSEDQEKLQRSDYRNRWGGLAFATFLVGALVWTLAQAIAIMTA